MRYLALTLVLAMAALPVGAQSGSCADQTDEGLCLNGDRFLVTAQWRTATSAGEGTPQQLTNDTGYFWFFDSNNVELVVKVLNACGVNQTYWVFAAGLTNVEVTLTVTDTQTSAQKTYFNPQGTEFVPVQDTTPFFQCP